MDLLKKHGTFADLLGDEDDAAFGDDAGREDHGKGNKIGKHLG